MKGLKDFVFCVMAFLSLAAVSTPLHAAPTEITECGIISQSGSYVVSRNLRVPPNSVTGDCISIRADFVTIDLSGFTIRGLENATFGSGFVVQGGASLRRNITIRNGSVREFQTGVDLGTSGENVTIESVNFQDNRASAVELSEMAVVKGCTFFRNGQGLRVGSRSIVTGNLSNSNTQTGIRVGDRSLVEGNVSDSNRQDGIVVGRNSTVLNNTAVGNTGIGLSVTCPSNVIGNTARGNGTNLLLQGAGCNDSNNIP